MRKQKATKAARILALDELDQAGLLDGLTARELGALLQVDPATAHRTRHDLNGAREMARELIDQVRRRLNNGKDT